MRIGMAPAQSLDYSLVKHLQDSPPHGRFDGVGRIEALIDGAQVLLQHLRIDGKGVRRLVVEMPGAAIAVIAIMQKNARNFQNGKPRALKGERYIKLMHFDRLNPPTSVNVDNDRDS